MFTERKQPQQEVDFFFFSVYEEACGVTVTAKENGHGCPSPEHFT